MPPTQEDLGKMVAAYPTAPSFVQRAAIIAILSFLFFLAMLVAFLARQQIGYLVLAAAFLILNIFTLTGFIMQRRNVVRVFEDGLGYGKSSVKWRSIASVDTDNEGLKIVSTSGGAIRIPKTIDDLGRLSAHIHRQTHL